MKCPNCGKEFRPKDVTSETGSPETLFSTDVETGLTIVTQGERAFPCPNCPAVVKTSVHFKRLANLRNGALGWAAASGFFSALLSIASNEPDTRLFAAVLLILMGGSSISVSVIAQVLLLRVNRWEVDWMRAKCKYCGTMIGLRNAEFCLECGARIELPTFKRLKISEEPVEAKKQTRKVPRNKPAGTCLVCGLEINTVDIAHCPHCGNTFHRNHLTEWIRKRKHCPACGEHLVESEMK